jgi:hypothetical protein
MKSTILSLASQTDYTDPGIGLDFGEDSIWPDYLLAYFVASGSM